MKIYYDRAKSESEYRKQASWCRAVHVRGLADGMELMADANELLADIAKNDGDHVGRVLVDIESGIIEEAWQVKNDGEMFWNYMDSSEIRVGDHEALKNIWGVREAKIMLPARVDINGDKVFTVTLWHTPTVKNLFGQIIGEMEVPA